MAAMSVTAIHRTDTASSVIPVARERLPMTADLAPYLARVDEGRWRSNVGPLLREFEARLEARFERPTAVTTFASPTAAITLALRALDCEPGGLCAMPAWTAPASAEAVRRADLEPWFLDVDPATWMLDPAATVDSLRTAPGPVAAMLPAAAFGRLPDLGAWARVARHTATPVLIDAAGAFDSLNAAPVPVAVNLGPAEVVSSGDGGFLASEDAGFIERVRDLVALGERGGSPGPVSASRLSDHAAAMGLASLDAWPETRRRIVFAAQYLKVALALTPQIVFQPGWGSHWFSNICVVGVPGGAAAALTSSLTARGVETRAWWGGGVHAVPDYANCLRHELPITDRLAASTLGLPFFTDLDEPTSWRIVDALIDALKEISVG